MEGLGVVYEQEELAVDSQQTPAGDNQAGAVSVPNHEAEDDEEIRALAGNPDDLDAQQQPQTQQQPQHQHQHQHNASGGYGDYAQSSGQHPQQQMEQHHGYDKNGSSTQPGKLFIGGVSWETTEDTLRQHFGKYGALTDAALMKDKYTGQPRGFGFVTFADASAIDHVLDETHTLDGRSVEVKRAIPRERTAPGPSDFRGGRGGYSSGGFTEQKKIFVGGLAPTVTEQDFRHYFEEFGKITDAVVMIDRDTQRSRGFGFITFEEESSVAEVISKNHEIHGKNVEKKEDTAKMEPSREARAARLLLVAMVMAVATAKGEAPVVLKEVLADDRTDTALDELFAGSENAAPPASKLLLADIPDTNPPKDINVTLEIKSWWLAGLIKEGHYDNAASVLDQIGNLDEISIAGAIQQNETIALLDVDLKVAARWLRIAQFALANHLVHQQKFMLALRICSQIDVHSLEDQERIVVLSRVGRIRLQMGDLTAAEKLFEAARYHTSQLKTESGNGTGVTAEVLAELEARLLLNDGLLFFAQNKLQEALSAFDSILYLQNTQIATIENSDAELFLEEDVVCSAVNNYAICALYCCDVKAAVAALERMIRSNPMRFLNGVVVFNLSSLYDLLFDNATSKSRKEMMKKIAHLYDLEHVDPATYRI
ncbi:hypothetical protein JG688_00015668 [Phytophthora aleatoria]|uniref:RRM domain-containing protein n=1 Tax=Phytophthora aleatoria TaxID=2496075 RepID=A0A8J5IZ60_9STRA|nr:hypothetical protein JG688_00015668 [Phytophthora aleatoria]